MRDKEIGSFLELQLPTGREYYSEEKLDNVECEMIRLNSARAAIYHAVRVLGCDVIYLPYYQCQSVRDFLTMMNVKVKYYYIDADFNPVLEENEEKSCFLIVNYFGIMGTRRMSALTEKYNHVIVDNSQAFFARPIPDCMNVYSARKFIGVPDGAYLIGKHVCKYSMQYEQDYSSDTSLFLLLRMEYGCEGKAYETREQNEKRLETGIRRMSGLTRKILDGTDYAEIIKKRRENFEYASEKFNDMNGLKPLHFYSKDSVPMVYPLLFEDSKVLPYLLVNKIFQGNWWKYILQELSEDTFECHLSQFMIPITIDQRYELSDIQWMSDLIHNFIEKN